MKQSILILACFGLATQVFAAPQLVSFKDGKIRVNFGGYHAGVGFGGLFDGSGRGGLSAEAGTPYGQSARAGLGGAFSNDGKAAGGLYAGAVAAPNVKAEAGLAGGVTGEHAAGNGFASAIAGNRFSGLDEVPADVIETEAVQPIVKHKKVHKEYNFETVKEAKPIYNEVQFNPAIEADANIKTSVQTPTVVGEVYDETPVVYEKRIIKHKPLHHHRKTAYIGGYIGGGAAAPEIQKRIDVDSSANAHADIAARGGSSKEVTYTKQLTYQRNPNFFADIFNIPIQTLKAVSNLLGNTAANTNVSIQKTASVHADTN